MTKKNIDFYIQKNWDEILLKKSIFQSQSKWKVEDDVLGWAYDYLILNKNKFKSEKDVVSFYLQRIKNACQWSRSGYLKNNKEQSMKDCVIEVIAPQHVNESFEIDKCIIDSFENTLKNEEKILLNLILTGYDNSGKLSAFTSIPRTSCYLMIRNLKRKLKDYVEN